MWNVSIVTLRDSKESIVLSGISWFSGTQTHNIKCFSFDPWQLEEVLHSFQPGNDSCFHSASTGLRRKNSTYQNGSVKTRIGHGFQWSVGTEGRVLSFREMTSSEFTVYMEIEQGCWVSLSFLTSNPSHHWWLPGGRRCMLLIQQKKSYVMRNSKGKVWCLWHCYISCHPEVGVCKDNM